MFTAFNLKLDEESLFIEQQRLTNTPIGNNLYTDTVRYVHSSLDKYILQESTIDGTKLQNDWFPNVNADVFLSHSHKDKDLAIQFAGVLKNRLKINTFIDSCIWGYAGDLLLDLDSRYCQNQDGTSYNYEKRNISTSHVHMMLNTALMKMIDKCECIIFLNTPNSTVINNLINGTTNTYSPWIYSEISMTQVVRKRKPDRLIYEVLQKSQGTEARSMSLKVQYLIELGHMTNLSLSDIMSWIATYERAPNGNALDVLYKAKGQEKEPQVLRG